MSAISPGPSRRVDRGLAPEDWPGTRPSPPWPEISLPDYGYARWPGPGTGPRAWPRLEGRLVFAFQPHASHFLATRMNCWRCRGPEPEEALFFANLETAVTLLLDGRTLIGGTGGHLRPGHRGPALDPPFLRPWPCRPGDPGSLSRRRLLSEDLGPPEPGPFDPEAMDASGRRLFRQAAPAPGGPLPTRSPATPPPWTRPSPPPGSTAVVIGSWYGRRRSDLNLGSRFHRSRMRLISGQVSSIDPELDRPLEQRRRIKRPGDSTR